MSAADRALAALLPAFPRGLVHLVARRYVAGTSRKDALECVARLNARGIRATVDILGEDVLRREEALTTRDGYLELIEEMAAHRLDSNVSVKLSALGLRFDPELCERSLVALCDAARRHASFVRIDMEDSSLTQATLDLHARVRREHDNVGPVLQARLRRTVADAHVLAAAGANVRLCKGIYRERREIAWTDREIVRRNFAWILRILLDGGCHVGIATHDELLVWEALRIVDELHVDRTRYEFQMLLGVEEQLRQVLVTAGHPLRVYVPFGRQWYEYSLRRLKENPEIAGHVARATLRGLLPSRAHATTP